MVAVHRSAAPAAFICFTRSHLESFVGVCRSGAAEFRTGPRASAATALLEALAIAARLHRLALAGAL
jgi:hypothetical protein